MINAISKLPPLKTLGAHAPAPAMLNPLTMHATKKKPTIHRTRHIESPWLDGGGADKNGGQSREQVAGSRLGVR